MFIIYRKNFYIPNNSDVYLSAKSYECHEDVQKRLNFDGNARTIQKAYRTYRILKYIRKWAKEYRQTKEDCMKLENERTETLRFVLM